MIDSPDDGPPSAAVGWYTNRLTGQLRYWNGEAWEDAAPAPAAQPTRPSNGLAVAGLVLGLVGLILTITLVGAVVGIPVGLVGLFIAAFAVRRSRVAGGRGMAVWGVVLNTIPVLVLVLGLIGLGAQGWRLPSSTSAQAAAATGTPSSDPAATDVAINPAAAAPAAPAQGHYELWVSSCGDNPDKLGKEGTQFDITAGTSTGTDQLTAKYCAWSEPITTTGFESLYVSGQLQGTGVLYCWITDTDTGRKLVEHGTNSEYGIASCSTAVGSL